MPHRAVEGLATRIDRSYVTSRLPEVAIDGGGAFGVFIPSPAFSPARTFYWAAKRSRLRSMVHRAVRNSSCLPKSNLTQLSDGNDTHCGDVDSDGVRMNFDVAGPFEISRHGPKDLITKQSIIDLRQSLENCAEGLCEACGCYVFALRAGPGYTPYYVGQSCKNSILNEALNPPNVGKYNEILADSKGTPIIFLLPLLTPGKKYRRKTKGDGRLQRWTFYKRWLIAEALRKNENLKNNKETKFLRGIHVVGIFNATQGEATNASKVLKDVLY